MKRGMLESSRGCAPESGVKWSPTPLKVTHVVLALDVGGSERNVINQVREGHALGQCVSVVCVERPGVLAPQVEALGGQLICLHKHPGIQAGLFGRMRAALRDLRPDIVHTHHIGTLFYAGPAALGIGRARVVHTEHGRYPYADQMRTRWLGRLAGIHVDRFFCLTEAMASEVVANRIVPRRKVRVIMNGIDTAQYRERGDAAGLRRSLGIPDGAPVIGTVGRLVEIKCQDLLIRAFARVKQCVPDAHLLLVGDGPLMRDLDDLAIGLGLAPSVHFVGYQPYTWNYFHVMNYFALTSRSEGMPQAVLEASVAGLPVVASRVGGLPEVIDDGRTGILFAPGDESALVGTLLRLIGDNRLARGLGEAGRCRVESMFHISRMASDYHNHFLELLGIP